MERLVSLYVSDDITNTLNLVWAGATLLRQSQVQERKYGAKQVETLKVIFKLYHFGASSVDCLLVLRCITRRPLLQSTTSGYQPGQLVCAWARQDQNRSTRRTWLW